MILKYNSYTNGGMLKHEDEMLFSTQTLLKITSGAALALALTACGGERDSTAGANAAGGNAAGANAASPSSALSILSKGITAFTVPGWTTFPMDISKNSDGSEILTLPDPTLGAQQVTIKSRDAQGNITEIDASGPIESVLSLMGNRVGMICGVDGHFKKDPNPSIASSSHYAYLSDDFVEVDHRELRGLNFRQYTNCDAEYYERFGLDKDGMISDLDNPSEPQARSEVEAYTAEGFKIDDVIARSKAYKFTADGKTTYVDVQVVSLNPDFPDAKPGEQGVYLAISE